MSAMMLQHKLSQWQQQWNELLASLQHKGADVFRKWEQPATEQELAELEQQLGITLPHELKQALTIASEAWMGWTLPHTSLVPFDANGDWGWSLQTINWLDVSILEDTVDPTRYLSFYHAHNGDSLVLDMHVQPQQPAVLSWNHETDEFQFLAPSLGEFLERVTVLYGIGAEAWQYEPFADYSGLNVNHPNTIQWRSWMEDYLHLTLEKAQGTLEGLIRYAEMVGKADELLRAAFNTFAPELVLQAWQQRIEQESDRGLREALMEYTGELCGSYAADWVRSLWKTAPAERINASILAYVTAHCLPEQEGLALVFAELERMEETSRLNGYTANAWLKPFENRKVIEWMTVDQRVSYPYDGWDRLFACSAPLAEDIWQWLGGSSVQRQVVISALATIEHVHAIFLEQDQLQHTLELLEQELEKAVTKKEKNLVNCAIHSLNKR
ncbi:SMI1/KNR4 family protein [Paenibacillus wenxiniae]|uniref:SMI1/KNR4 family protein n=1 Tax=Paenibacillus wenxiniae TaxID=1636843 RepID=A0ABW4RIA6_9BACL